MHKLLKSEELYNKYCFVSPIHCYGFMYEETDYSRGLSFCTDLLKHCDIMLLCGNWKDSRGCRAEMELCNRNNIKVLELPTDAELDNLIKLGDIEDCIKQTK